MRRHGFSDVQNIKNWNKYGGNFKITDLQSAMARIQLKNMKKNSKLTLKILIILKKLTHHKEYIKPVDLDTVWRYRYIMNLLLKIGISLQNS